MDYIYHIIILCAIYGILAVALNLALGYAGMLSLCSAAFFGIGAYAAALASIHTGANWAFSTLLAMTLAMIAGAVIGVVSLPHRGQAFALFSLAAQAVVSGIMINGGQLTNGPRGLAGIPPVRIGSWTLDTPAAFVPLALIIACIVMFLVHRISRSAARRIWLAIREDELVASTCGRNVFCHKWSIFILSAALSGIAGALYAFYISFIDPGSFGLMESLLIATMVILGGRATWYGPVIGASVLILLPEMLRLLGLPPSLSANIRQILYGLALVACMLWRPQGLIGEYSFGRGVKVK